MHWCNQRLARDWVTLKAQVRFWQEVVILDWSEADIEDVARDLNDTIYQFPRQVGKLGAATPTSLLRPCQAARAGQRLLP
jgi:hypothetical protein